jgi:hypothetical protein
MELDGNFFSEKSSGKNIQTQHRQSDQQGSTPGQIYQILVRAHGKLENDDG